jgi:hypothetical protein
MSQLQHELDAYRRINHEHVVKYLGSWWDAPHHRCVSAHGALGRGGHQESQDRRPEPNQGLKIPFLSPKVGWAGR